MFPCPDGDVGKHATVDVAELGGDSRALATTAPPVVGLQGIAVAFGGGRVCGGCDCAVGHVAEPVAFTINQPGIKNTFFKIIVFIFAYL